MTNKLKYFVGNWKMFGNLASSKKIYTIQRFSTSNKKIQRRIKIILCVPNTLIYFMKNKFRSKRISIGAQNCHHYPGFGPFTGSISAPMLKNVGAEYVILGHSENRLEGDTNKIIKKKITSALDHNLKVIFCIGESIKQKKTGRTFSVLKKQIKNSIKNNNKLKNIIIAYEPIWSIGTGKIPKTKELKKIFKYIKNEFKKICKTKKPPIVLYGGSVNSKNIGNFSLINELDGFLIGGASKSSKKFIDIIRNYYK